MISYSTNFTREGDLNNPHKVLAVQLYYDDNSSFLGFSSKTVVIDDVQYIGATTKFSAPKTKWNWNGSNNVTVTAPTLSMANIETQNYSFIDDDFYTKNFFGRTIKVYFGFESLTTLSDYALVYQGRIDDIKYKDGELTIKFKSTEINDVSINGQLIDQATGTIGSHQVNNIPDSANGKCIPMIYGEHWNAPAVYYTENTFTEYVYKHAIQDISNDFFTYSGITTLLPTKEKVNTLLEEPSVYSPSDDMLSHVNQTSFGFYPDVYGNLFDVAEDSTNEFLGIEFDQDKPDIGTDGNVTIFTPMRFERPRYLNSRYEGDGNGPASDITVTDWENSQDGDPDSYCFIEWHGTDINIGNTHNWPIFGVLMGYLTPKWNLATDYVHSNEYGDWYTWHERAIHVPSNAGSAREATLHFKWIGHTSGHPINDDTIQLETFVWRGNELVGRWWYDRNPFTGEIDNDGWQLEDFYGDTNEGPVTMRISNYAGLNAEGAKLWPDGFGPVADTVLELNEQGEAILNPNEDPFFSSRASFDNLSLDIRFYCGEESGDYGWLRLYEQIVVHNGSLNVGNDLFCEARGMSVDTTEMLSMTDDGIQPLALPYEYIEAIIRAYTDATDSNFSSTWSDIPTIFEDLYKDRENSGFVIYKPTTLNKWLKEYCKDEMFTVYKDELDKYHIIAFKPTYDSGDVNMTIQHDDLIDLDVSLTPLKNVITNVESFKTDYQYFNDKCGFDSPFHISDGSYDYTYYDLENSETKGRFSKEEIKKKYTSYSTPYRVQNDGKSYQCLKKHVSDNDDYDINETGSFFPWDAWYEITYDSSDPAWVIGQEYAPYSLEAVDLAKRYLNQFGNRHRVVKFETTKLKYYGLQIGDVVNFRGILSSLLGMEVAGWGSDSNPESVTLNGQEIYEYFMITEVGKGTDKLTITAVQLHNLDSLDTDWGNPS